MRGLHRWGHRAVVPVIEAMEARRMLSTVPTGFAEAQVVTGLVSPTSMAVAPDGRVFVAQQNGTVRLIKNDAAVSAPVMQLSVDSTGERGILGIAVDPHFSPDDPYLYVYYTATSPSSHNRLSRFTLSGDTVAPSSETILLDLPPVGAGIFHMGGGIHFGSDGALYLGVGQQQNTANPQSLDNPFGKILRIARDGTIPADNPFYNSTTGINKAIWATGLRNPYTSAFQPETGLYYINDVGEGSWEEINQGVAGGNYGWPSTEGYTSYPLYQSPVYAYPHGPECAITGGDFYNPQTVSFPSQYVGKYLFTDFCGGWIKAMDPATKQISDFVTGISFPNDIRVAPDGGLYYVSRGNDTGGQPNTGAVYKITYTGSLAPYISAQPGDQTVAAGEDAIFSISASGPGTLAYQWQRDGVNIDGATQAHYTLAGATAADDSAQFSVTVSSAGGTTTSSAANLSVVQSARPTATLTLPGADTIYRAGDTIQYAAAATDSQGNALPASAYTWRVDFHHHEPGPSGHSHPFLAPISGQTGGSFTIPVVGETDPDVLYRIVLTVQDSNGLTSSVFRDVTPHIATLTLASNVAGLKLNLDGQPRSLPLTISGVTGITRTLSAPLQQTLNGTTYTFGSWSDGGAASHDLAFPESDTTYTANYTSVPPPSLPLFLAPVGQSTGNHAHGVVAGDFNGDSNLDLAVANAGSDSISVLLGNGDTTFAGATNYAVSDQPKSVFAQDLNADGHLDLLSACQGVGQVSVLMNLGNGAFAPAVNYSSPAGSHELVAADLNRDGYADIAVVGHGASVVRILINQGDGTFSSGTNYAVGSAPHSIIAADFNHNGKIDLAVANRNSNNLALLRGNGNGTFLAATFITTGGGPHSVRSGDFNNDGLADLASANENSANVSVFIGNGSGGFAAAVNYPSGKAPKGIAVGDVNNDGRLDLLTANSGGNYPSGANPAGMTLSVLLGNGNGTFGSRIDWATGHTPFGIALADFDSDGDLDAASANWHSDNVTLLRNTTVLPAPPANRPPLAVDDTRTTAPGTAVQIPVLANDGDSDGALVPTSVTLIVPPANGSVTISPTTGVITYTPASSFTGSDFFYYAVKDDDGATGNAAKVTVNVATGSGASNGLLGTYFSDRNLTNVVAARLDSTVNVDWGTNSPAPGVPADSFSVRWTGQVQAKTTGTYTFYTTADDGVRLWVNGQRIINDWKNHSAKESKGTISLMSGRRYDIKMEYYDNTGQAVCKLSWSASAVSKEIIPATNLFPPAPVNPIGLRGEYFDNADLTNLKLTRTDSVVDFNWGTAAPASGIAANSFSVRWTGFVKPLYSQTYTFYVNSDDGVRLWVNGQQLINDWTNHSAQENKGTITLTAGQLYDIWLEYYDNTGSARCHLSWSSSSQIKQAIPQSQLYS